mgnify:CR=1 FL=1
MGTFQPDRGLSYSLKVFDQFFDVNISVSLLTVTVIESHDTVGFRDVL